jgi:large subunit ribosomal protein L29
MAQIVELQEKSNDKLEEMLENAREELFNLRFQKAAVRLDNTARLRIVRREVAQLETTLNLRRLAEETAAKEPEIAAALADQEWRANTRYIYEDSGWRVQFVDKDGKALATALVNLNKAQPRGRAQRARKNEPRLVVSYEVNKR